MAVRTPLRMFQDGNNDWQIRQMTQAEIDAIVIRLAESYGSDPSISINYTGNFAYSDGTGFGGTYSFNDPSNPGGIYDIDPNEKRWRTGTAKTSVSSYPAESITGEPELVTTFWGGLRITDATLDANPLVDTDNKRFPLYYTASGNLQAMNIADVRDTFIYPAFDYIAGLSSISGAPAAEDVPGIGYRVVGRSGVKDDGNINVPPTAPTGYTIVYNSEPIYRDTFSNQTAYTDGTAENTIGTADTTQDYYEYVSYWLFRKDAATPSAYADSGNAKPIIMKPGTNDIQIIDDVAADLLKAMKAIAQGDGGTGTRRLIYRVVDATTTSLDIMGSIMNDSEVDATGQTGVRKTRFVNANDYRAQEFPIGTVSVQRQFALVLDPNTTV
jgi:hypothetical protein